MTENQQTLLKLAAVNTHVFFAKHNLRTRKPLTEDQRAALDTLIDTIRSADFADKWIEKFGPHLPGDTP